MTFAPKISIIIPTWNNLEMLKLCLRSIVEHTELPYEVVLHVNDGKDGTLDWVRREQIPHTWSAHNVGICHATNLAVQKCRADYLVYLNDDMYVLPGWERSLYDMAAETADREPAYVSGTWVQPRTILPSAILADYGTDLKSFDEDRLLRDFRAGVFATDDWNGATWPPTCVHRKWWHLVGGYSIEFSPGFYSDIDFSMKLWQIGCRRFVGSASSLVYHFGEKTTSQIRGKRKRNVRAARRLFLRKWGVLPTTFKRYYLRAGQRYSGPVAEAELSADRWERLRLWLLTSVPRRRKAPRRSSSYSPLNVATHSAGSA